MTGTPRTPGFRSGFVTLVGRPNVGKSTLLNQLVGTKVSIVSNRPQTTRNQVRGVLGLPPGDGGAPGDGAQVVFIDTPGIHKPQTELGRRLNQRSLETFGAVDVVCFLIEAQAAIGAGDRFIARCLREVGTPVVLVVNKVDAAGKAAVLGQLAEAAATLGDFAAYVPLSAATGEGTDALLAEVIERLPEGPRYYPDDVVTDQPDTFLAAELVREKLLAMARQELPHSLAVTVEEIEERPGPLLVMRAVIRVERDSQKAIVIGKSGSVIKEAGTAARKELEALLGAKVYLETHVKVEPDWQRSPSALDRLGY
ncbi:MAG: GTPase Era [Acidimicrobiia bacterium]